MAEPIRRVGKGEENVNDAAARALLLLAHTPRIGQQEFMTMLFRDPSNELIFRAPFQTQGNRFRSEFSGLLPGDVAGLVHNHPLFQRGLSAPTTRFSVTDAETAQQLQVPAFLLAPQGNGVLPEERQLDPQPKDVRVSSAAANEQGIAGDEFVAKFPVDLLLQIIARENPVMRALLLERAKEANNGSPNQR